jgi:hypothetical protein
MPEDNVCLDLGPSALKPVPISVFRIVRAFLTSSRS